MILDHIFTARYLMQVVDVLRDDRLQSAHLFEYAVLGLLSWRAAAFDFGAVRSALIALLLIVGMASADEWRQSQLAERTGALADVWLDTLGGLLGVCVIALWRRHTRGADRKRG